MCSQFIGDRRTTGRVCLLPRVIGHTQVCPAQWLCVQPVCPSQRGEAGLLRAHTGRVLAVGVHGLLRRQGIRWWDLGTAQATLRIHAKNLRLTDHEFENFTMTFLNQCRELAALPAWSPLLWSSDSQGQVRELVGRAGRLEGDMLNKPM